MRFLLYDRILELKKGDSIYGVKSITLSEDMFSEPSCEACYMPEALIVEALAQVAGWLVNVSLDFRRSSLMSMVKNAKFHGRARAGDQLLLKAKVVRIDNEVALASAEATTREGAVAEIEEILFVLIHLSEEQIGMERRKFAYFSGNYRTE